MSRKHWVFQATRGALYSLPLLAAFIALKISLQWIDPERYHLFEPDLPRQFGASSMGMFMALAISYAVLTFGQEFIRCAVQGSLRLFATVGNEEKQDTGWKPMLVANVVFAALHMHLGPVFAAGAFIVGLFWGWMYLRTNSYLTTAFSHALVGCLVLFVFGFPA